MSWLWRLIAGIFGFATKTAEGLLRIGSGAIDAGLGALGRLLSPFSGPVAQLPPEEAPETGADRDAKDEARRLAGVLRLAAEARVRGECPDPAAYPLPDSLMRWVRNLRPGECAALAGAPAMTLARLARGDWRLMPSGVRSPAAVEIGMAAENPMPEVMSSPHAEAAGPERGHPADRKAAIRGAARSVMLADGADGADAMRIVDRWEARSA
jgi:hypothetical protein